MRRKWSNFRWCYRHRRFTFWDIWGCQTCMNEAVQAQRTRDNASRRRWLRR